MCGMHGGGGRGEVTCNYCTCPHSGDCKAYESYNPDVEDGKKKAMKCISSSMPMV